MMCNKKEYFFLKEINIDENNIHNVWNKRDKIYSAGKKVHVDFFTSPNLSSISYSNISFDLDVFRIQAIISAKHYMVYYVHKQV